MNFITTSRTPVYKVASNGFFTSVRSLASGTEVNFTTMGIDDKSDRPIGFLTTGEILYTDTLTRLLDEVTVKSTRLWGWLIALGLTAAGIGYGVYKHKKKK